MSLNNQELKISKKKLYFLYWKRELSTLKIAKIYGYDSETIRRKMIKYHIKRRKLHERKYKISEGTLNKLYNKEKMSTLEIAKKYGCSQWVIWSLMRKYNLKRRDANEYHKWKEPGNLIKPILNHSPSISYIIGVILGDGWIYKQKHFYSICLETNDKLFCEKFKEVLQIIKLNPCLIKKTGKTWRTTATSKLFYNWFKSLKLKDIQNIATKYPTDFLRGFYESEGCLSINKDKRYGYEYPMITIVNTKKELIMLSYKLLRILDFHPTVHRRNVKPPRKPIWALNISKQKEVPTFFKKIEPCIKCLR